MAEDSLLVALIRESVEAPGRPRRLAALVLVAALGTDRDADATVHVIAPELAEEVADEVRRLARQYGLYPSDR